MISIFVEKITPRLIYTYNLIFKQLLGINYQFVTTVEQYKQCNTFKLCYRKQKVNAELFLYADSLLFTQGTSRISLECGSYNGLPTLFINKSNDSCLPFDLFAASFYLVTRYEEYNSPSVDQHQRFQAHNSFAFKNKFLHRPVINLWANQFKKILAKQFPDLKFKTPSFKFVPSYDIDHAWAFKNKGVIRNSLQLARSLVSLNFSKTRLIANVLRNKTDDPFYSFSHLEALFKSNSVAPLFFFLLGQYGKYDKNVSIKSEKFKFLIQHIAKQFKVGIHPSYRAHLNPQRLKSEQQTLQQLLEHPITLSRQHFLRLKLPETYELLIDAGITDDYTMGYAAQPGFRASIAHPFPWYDLVNETATNLTVHPFQFMDVTLRVYLKQSTEQAKITIQQLIDETIAVDGQLISLWHNSSLSDYDGWDGWRAVHDYIFEYVAKHLKTSA